MCNITHLDGLALAGFLEQLCFPSIGWHVIIAKLVYSVSTLKISMDKILGMLGCTCAHRARTSLKIVFDVYPARVSGLLYGDPLNVCIH